jgi:hypothetical protein
MNIAIVGQNIPARIIARVLLKHGHNVCVYGSIQDSGALTQVTPIYLWSNFDWEEYLQEPKITFDKISCCWLPYYSEDFNREYMKRTVGLDKVGIPFNGKDFQYAIHNGIEILHNHLPTFNNGNATYINPQRCIVNDVRYDRIVNTLPYFVYNKIVRISDPNQADKRPEYTINHEQLTHYYYFNHDKYFERWQLSKGVLYFSGAYEWNRLFYSDRVKGYVVESTREIEHLKLINIRPTKIALTDPIYPQAVVPVGRFAECDPSLNTSDIIRRRLEYYERICGNEA